MQNTEIIKIAYDYLKKHGFNGIYKLSDIGNSVVAFGGNPKEKIYGCRSVEVNKITGEIKLFGAWLPENIKVLEMSTDIDIPEMYSYENS